MSRALLRRRLAKLEGPGGIDEFEHWSDAELEQFVRERTRLLVEAVGGLDKLRDEMENLGDLGRQIMLAAEKYGEEPE